MYFFFVHWRTQEVFYLFESYFLTQEDWTMASKTNCPFYNQNASVFFVCVLGGWTSVLHLCWKSLTNFFFFPFFSSMKILLYITARNSLYNCSCPPWPVLSLPFKVPWPHRAERDVVGWVWTWPLEIGFHEKRLANPTLVTSLYRVQIHWHCLCACPLCVDLLCE